MLQLILHSLNSTERAALVLLVSKVNSKGQPIKPPEAPIGNGEYTSWNVVEVEGGQPAKWWTGQEMVRILREFFFAVSEEYVDQIFGADRPGVRQRALVSIEGGCIDFKTMKVCRVVNKSNGNPVWMLTVKVTPSMKSTDVYWTTIVSTAHANKTYMSCPFSGCDCPSGQNFCSHMLAVVYLIMLVQENDDMKFDDIFRTLSKPVLDLQSIAVRLSFIY